MKPVAACYDRGVLKPATPLALRAGEWVNVIVVRRPDPQRRDVTRLARGAAEDVALAEQCLAEWADGLDAEDRSLPPTMR
jgi:predicted DNA-binding antitoxin AbrB/MazE fold protein